MSPNAKVRCHYEVLGVERDADAATIKKAHRKLALKWHPDKNAGCKEAEHEFRLVQEAYECLSDPAERKWFDEHRESILRGGKGFDGGEGSGSDGGISFLFDVIPYHYGACYDGYGDDDDGFYGVYGMVFREVVKGEQNGWVSEGNIDEEAMPNFHLLSVDFGNSSSEWADVSNFYGAWESFSSCLSFAWADQYDPRDAQNRRIRRAIDDENRKARKVAKRERNNDVVQLVQFVKRRDPRVKKAKERAEQERIAREAEMAKEVQRKKAEAAIAREEWRAQAEEAMAATEADDADAGRIRLADLNDSDDDFYGGKKGRKKGKKGKKGKKKNRKRWSDDDDSEQQDAESSSQHKLGESASATAENENGPDSRDVASENGDTHAENGAAVVHERVDGDDGAERTSQEGGADKEEEFISSEEEEEESEEEPDFWRCDCCRKDFKSEKQLENHLKSKKHREAWKKYEKKMKKEAKEQELMEDLLDDLDVDG